MPNVWPVHCSPERLAACVNVLPGVRSFYHWKGEIESSQEFLLLVKTSRDLFPALRTEIERLHPYELPEVIALPVVAGSDNYSPGCRPTCAERRNDRADFRYGWRHCRFQRDASRVLGGLQPPLRSGDHRRNAPADVRQTQRPDCARFLRRCNQRRGGGPARPGQGAVVSRNDGRPLRGVAGAGTAWLFRTPPRSADGSSQQCRT